MLIFALWAKLFVWNTDWSNFIWIYSKSRYYKYEVVNEIRDTDSSRLIRVLLISMNIEKTKQRNDGIINELIISRSALKHRK